MSLFWRMFCLNAVGLVVAAALLLGPVTVSTPVLPAEALVVAAGLGVLLVANAVVLRIGLAPLGRLGRAMASADLLRPGGRAVVSGPVETAELIMTYNAMLDRLEAERAASAGRALSAQESERHRIARELHDEVGQTLTAVLLQLKRVADRGPDELREEIGQAQEATRAGLDEIRRIARRLRPGVLDELGLVSALRSLAAEFTTHGLTVRRDLAAGLPPFPEESELVIYRVAQEALTNTARHAAADRADLSLRAVPGGAELVVRDNGKGFRGAAEGAGIPGMRERALLVGARLTLGDAPGGGAEVRLRIPVVLPVEGRMELRGGYGGVGAGEGRTEFGPGAGFSPAGAGAGAGAGAVEAGFAVDRSGYGDGAAGERLLGGGGSAEGAGDVSGTSGEGMRAYGSEAAADGSASDPSRTGLPPAPGGEK